MLWRICACQESTRRDMVTDVVKSIGRGVTRWDGKSPTMLGWSWVVAPGLGSPPTLRSTATEPTPAWKGQTFLPCALHFISSNIKFQISNIKYLSDASEIKFAPRHGFNLALLDMGNNFPPTLYRLLAGLSEWKFDEIFNEV